MHNNIMIWMLFWNNTVRIIWSNIMRGFNFVSDCPKYMKYHLSGNMLSKIIIDLGLSLMVIRVCQQ